MVTAFCLLPISDSTEYIDAITNAFICTPTMSYHHRTLLLSKELKNPLS